MDGLAPSVGPLDVAVDVLLGMGVEVEYDQPEDGPFAKITCATVTCDGLQPFKVGAILCWIK